MKTVLITGASGFLASACAFRFHSAGWYVIGISRSPLSPNHALSTVYNRWISSVITADLLLNLEIVPDVVLHCSGCSSVYQSKLDPLSAFESIVNSTAIILEYLRLFSPKSILLYPSSAAVYGQKTKQPLVETDIPQPISLYGYYKLMVENLLASYATSFGQKSISVRFFSIYGVNLRKQLLWDASLRILSGESSITFSGTGNETRDWMHVSDASSLLLLLADTSSHCSSLCFDVINGSSGDCLSIVDILQQLSFALRKNVTINFDGTIRIGDPRFYRADTSRVFATGWKPSVSLQNGLADYAKWINSIF